MYVYARIRTYMYTRKRIRVYGLWTLCTISRRSLLIVHTVGML